MAELKTAAEVVANSIDLESRNKLTEEMKALDLKVDVLKKKCASVSKKSNKNFKRLKELDAMTATSLTEEEKSEVIVRQMEQFHQETELASLHGELGYISERLAEIRAMLDDNRPYTVAPSSLAVSTAVTALANIENLPLYAQRQRRLSHSRKVSHSHKDNTEIISTEAYGTDKDKLLLEFVNPGVLAEHNEQYEKMLIMFLMKAMEQSYDFEKRVIRRDYIQFDAAELVKNRIFLKKSIAKQDFVSMAKTLAENIAIKGEFEHGSLKGKLKEFYFIFTGAKLTQDGQCFVFLNNNKEMQWDFVFEFACYPPKEIMQLKNGAFKLAYDLFVQARKNNFSIAKNGYITLKLRTIQNNLGLPNEKNTKDAKRDIKQKIIKYVDEINGMAAEHGEKYHVEIIATGKNVSEWLDNGSLKMVLTDEYAKKLTEIYNAKLIATT